MAKAASGGLGGFDGLVDPLGIMKGAGFSPLTGFGGKLGIFGGN